MIDSNTKAALQFSGGKDSTALLWFLKDFWPHLTVYHYNTNDRDPEIVKVVNWAREQVPHFVEIIGDVERDRKQFGLPTDLLPWQSTALAHLCGVGSGPVLQDRIQCCFRSIMMPLHEHMMRDGINLIIRGQKRYDHYRGPLRDGEVINGIKMWYPIESWRDEDVFAYIAEHNLPVANFYKEGLIGCGDCLRCTAWYTEGNREEYLRRHYPEELPEFSARMDSIRCAVKAVKETQWYQDL